MATLPIRRMILYKHGVGFYERRGTLDGEDVQFTFRLDEINDALKSLTVIDRAGGEVLGVHYETPEDKAARFADSSISLSPDHSLLDLLRSLRGRSVRLELAEGERTGRLLGVDVDEHAPLEKSVAVLLEASTQSVASFLLTAVRRVSILDERAAYDLRFFLDTAMSEEVRRAVSVRLSPGAHDLSVFYLAPSPTWRVSYRVVAERAGADQGRLLLQGWGLFDNRLDEDLADVQVTLVAGMPISFIYDLATSRIPARPVVADTARVAAAPVEFAEALEMASAADSAAPGMAMGGMARGKAGMRAMAPAAPMMQSMDMERVAATPAQATGSDLGELFQYAVTAPVSVRRGESAMVPIVAAQLEYQRELLYNGQKMPRHPVVAARFSNGSGLTLERGPVTVVEDGDYRGEAIVPFTKTGGEVYLAYAVELGVKVEERSWNTSEMAALSLRGAYLVVEEWFTQHTEYSLENTTGSDLSILVEKARLGNYEVMEPGKTDAETSEHRRWRVTAPARRKTEFLVRERTRRSRFEQVLDQSYDQLRKYLDDKWLDAKTYERLKGLLDERAQIARNHQELQTLQNERNEIYARQEQLRKNMDVMKDNAEEVQLRRRLRQQLEQAEDRLGAIDQRVAALKRDNEDRERRVQDALQKLTA